MQASLFYQTQASSAAIPLILLTKDDIHTQLLTLDERTQHSFREQQFSAQAGEVCLIYQHTQLAQVYLGLGDKTDAQAIELAMNRLPKGLFIANCHLSTLALLSWGLIQYRFDRYKKNQKRYRQLLLSQAQFDNICILVNAIFLVRDLINTPANHLTPVELGDAVQDLANVYHGTVNAIIDQSLLTANFPAIYAVGQASIHRPRLLELTWGDSNHPKISLIGKGVCFDSGGLNIKAGNAMRIMKKDMGGAAHVLGLAAWIMATKLPVYLQVLIPAVENAVGSNSFRPGDILTMRNGLTVEIDNTDAEGRLVLADAMSYAVENNPELIIDFATLTGAARVAVGTEIAAMFSNCDKLAQAMLLAAREVDDPIWHMPLFKGYSHMLESAFADLANASPQPYAGAITAALFLNHFIPNTIPWLHFDVMAWNLANKPGKLEGGEAMGLRAVARYLEQKYRPSI